MWLTPDTLRNGAASGHYYENYVVMELVKNYAYAKFKVMIMKLGMREIYKSPWIRMIRISTGRINWK